MIRQRWIGPTIPIVLWLGLGLIALYLVAVGSGWDDGHRTIDRALGYSKDGVGDRQWWRFLTPNLIHTSPGLPGPRGLLHLAGNLVGLAITGVWLERKRGRAMTLVVLLTSACAAFLWLPLVHSSIDEEYFGGSSGMLWGLGAACVLGWRLQPLRPPLPVLYMASVVALNIFRLVTDGVQEPHLVHVGGALGGALGFALWARHGGANLVDPEA